ncbi:uncharacterized protein EDB91DRAFT_118501 [Suillus paluster]|uniref:uncharacterized protein n=1 Tax=Suillus paluster TaxID=48578 RepID=UPI001B87A207|nr:uncharacterized protein EDB91DRAFT_118501 [Suillus paluster]KAG1725019.1 hypothetical protein EDB91DRAFT_118501 [Suillus paluster]
MSSSMYDPLPRIDLGATYGALFIGAIVAALLFGLTNIQAFIYFQTHAGKRTTFYKLVVFWLWVLDAMHLALIVHSVYYYVVTNFGNISVLIEVVWSFKLQMVLNILIAYGTHLLYAHRIWIVGRDRSRAFLIIPAIVVVLGSGVALTLIWIVYDPYMNVTILQWPTFLALSTAALLDTLDTSSLCYLLATSRTGYIDTDSFITRLIGYSIYSGCLTSICSMASIITCAVMPKNFIFLSLQFLMAKLYVNSYIALLNARHYTQSNVNTTNFSELRGCHSDSLTGTHNASQEKLRKNVFSYPDREVVLPIRPIQAAMVSSCVTVDEDLMTCFSRTSRFE